MKVLIKLAVVLVVLIAVVTSATAQVVDRSSMTNKILCGYQGWHCCPGDGNHPYLGWTHWADDNSWIGPGNYHTEMWPDTTEYDTSDLFVAPNTTLTYGGTPYLYSASRQGPVNTHFRWMQEYSIDGAFVQRFTGGIVIDPNDPWYRQRNYVLQNVINAAETYGRTWAIEYDLSGDNDTATIISRLEADWNYLDANYGIASNSRYLRHNNKPVIMLFGIGYESSFTPATAQALINSFKTRGFFVGAGVPAGWRTRTLGSQTDPAWDAVYRSLNFIKPWTVGSYNDWGGIQWIRDNIWGPDITLCNSLGIIYLPTCWPRGGWDNMHDYPCGQSKVSPRGGQHLWDQIYSVKQKGTPSIFIAMFDEYDESTAIMKMSDNVPTSGCWWTNEGKNKDWWLRLANYGGKMLRGEIPLSQTIPISDSTSPDNAQIISNTIPSTMSAGQQYNVSVTVKNTGETAWNSSDWWKLGAVDDSDPFHASTREVMPAGVVVMPNQNYTFNFTMTAPSTTGTYTTDWRMVHELIRWFGGTLTKQVQVTAAQTPYSGVISLPGTIQAENFDNGGEGVSYHDLSAGNSGGAYRSNDVDIENTGDSTGAYNVGFIDSSEWLEYTVNVATAGSYDIKIRVASPNNGCTCHVEMNGVNVTGTMNVPNTGSWQTWTTVTASNKTLSAGQQVMRVVFDAGGYNLNFVEVASHSSTPVTFSTSSFDSDANGWAISLWRSGPYADGTMAWDSSAGRTGGGMRFIGSGATDNNDRCNREGSELQKTISTAGYSAISVSYDLRVNSMGSSQTGLGAGTCGVDHNDVQEQLTVYYSTNGGSSWTEASNIMRSTLLGYTSYGNRTIDLSGVSACNNNANFRLRFRWQANSTSDTMDLDNIKVTGTP